MFEKYWMPKKRTIEGDIAEELTRIEAEKEVSPTPTTEVLPWQTEPSVADPNREPCALFFIFFPLSYVGERDKGGEVEKEVETPHIKGYTIPGAHHAPI